MDAPAIHCNLLLRALEADNPGFYARLAPLLELTSLPKGTVLSPPGTAPRAIYFIEDGVVSVVGHTTGGHSLELGAVGHEGMTHIGWLLSGAPTSYSYVSQLAVHAQRLDGQQALRLFRSAPPGVFRLVDRFAQLVIAVVAQSALCARFHTSAQRLARRLLLNSDRAGSATLALTHEHIALMVGAPRSLVTEAMAVLRRSGCLESRRGVVTIRDRERLKRHACECFHADLRRLRAFRRTMESWSTHDSRQIGHSGLP